MKNLYTLKKGEKVLVPTSGTWAAGIITKTYTYSVEAPFCYHVDITDVRDPYHTKTVVTPEFIRILNDDPNDILKELL